MNAFSYHSPADLQREHDDHVANARYDYFSEAFGAEARLLDEQADDDREYYEIEQMIKDAEAMGVSPFEMNLIYCSAAERYAREVAVERARVDDECPF